MTTLRTVMAAALPLLFVSCMTDSPVKQAYRGHVPVLQGDGLFFNAPQNLGVDDSLLDIAYRLVYDDDRFVMARSLTVLRNGQLIGEAYPHDPQDAFQVQNIQSCTKSVTSMLTGIALSMGVLDSVGQRLSSIYPEYFANHPEKMDITIEDALTMRTGIDFNDGENTLELYQGSGSSIDYVLSFPKKYPPGIVFHYHDGSPQLVAAAIQKRYGKSLSTFADAFLFKRLDIKGWKWETAKDGITFGAFSLYLKPHDLAKIGICLADYGKYSGVQVIDSSWIARATKPRVNSDDRGASYGYYFWVYPAYQGFAAVGHGGQVLFVVPSKKLVVVYTAWPYTSDVLFDNFAELADIIVRACH